MRCSQVGRLGQYFPCELAGGAYYNAGISDACYYVVFTYDGIVVDECFVCSRTEVYWLPGDVDGF